MLFGTFFMLRVHVFITVKLKCVPQKLSCRVGDSLCWRHCFLVVRPIIVNTVFQAHFEEMSSNLIKIIYFDLRRNKCLDIKCLKGSNYKLMSFYNQKVKVELHCGNFFLQKHFFWPLSSTRTQKQKGRL